MPLELVSGTLNFKGHFPLNACVYLSHLGILMENVSIYKGGPLPQLLEHDSSRAS